MRERVKKGAVLIAVGASALTMFAADAQADWTRPVKPHGDFYLKRGVVIMTVHYKAPGGWRKAPFNCIGDGCDFHYTRRFRLSNRLATISELDRQFHSQTDLRLRVVLRRVGR